MLAAVSAMEGGWRFMVAAQSSSTLSAGLALLERAITPVIVAFWARLRGIAALGLPQ